LMIEDEHTSKEQQKVEAKRIIRSEAVAAW